jgi:hypothetical protein
MNAGEFGFLSHLAGLRRNCGSSPGSATLLIMARLDIKPAAGR